MPTSRPITFAVAVNNRELFETNFLASPCFTKPHDHQILVQENFDSAAKAYNDAIGRSVNDLIVFCHQDIVFPKSWLSQLERALCLLNLTDPRWGVLGCYGVTQNNEGRGHVYSFGVHGESFEHPLPVQTLDEIVLVLKKSSGLRFDERLPHFHLYGAGICLVAAKMGMKSYAISAFCIHNANQNFVLPKEFYDCYKHFKRIWKEHLPVQTTCIRVTKFDLPLYQRKLQEAYLRYIVRKEVGAKRPKNVQELLSQFGDAPQESRGSSPRTEPTPGRQSP
jgi:hypothetical protein